MRVHSYRFNVQNKPINISNPSQRPHLFVFSFVCRSMTYISYEFSPSMRKLQYHISVHPTGFHVPSWAHKSRVLQIQEHESSQLQMFIVIFTIDRCPQSVSFLASMRRRKLAIEFIKPTFVLLEYWLVQSLII